MWNTRKKSFQHLKDFIKNVPGSFYQEGVLSKEDKKSTYVADLKVFDTDAIFARMICLIGLKWIELETGLNYE